MPKKYSDLRYPALKLMNEMRKSKGDSALCFAMSYAILTQGIPEVPLALINQHPNMIRAVHGIVTDKTGKRVWHSWIEIESDRPTAIDPANDVIMPRELFNNMFHAKPEYYLTKHKYMSLVKKYRHAGQYTSAELRSV
jgi:hypothetical protein